MTPDDVTQALTALVAPGGRLHGRIEAADPAVEIVPAKVWQAFVWPEANAGAHLLRIYRIGAVDSVLAALWRNEARSLLRVSRRSHPALPRIRDAFADTASGFAFLLLEDPGEPLPDQPALVSRLAGSRIEAFQAFATLVEGLALLHSDGMLHRALTPRALSGHVREHVTLKLDRFQMSTLMAAWLRGGTAENREGAAWLSQLSPEELVCIAPERLGPMFGLPSRRLEGFSADVFGLGMIITPWFVGGLDAARSAAVTADGRYSRDAHEALIGDVHERLRNAGLPRELSMMLRQMTEPQPANRPPSALRVVESLRTFYGPVLAQFEAEAGHDVASPYQLWFLPQTVDRLYFRYKATKTHPEQLNEREYAELIVDDLEGGEICWSPEGFLPWLEREMDANARRKAREAKIVLIGRRFAYFSQYFQDYTTGAVDDRVVVIKYPCERRVVREHVDTARRRAAPTVRARYYAPPARVRPLTTRSWMPLIDPLLSDLDGRETSAPVAAAEWLVNIQAGRLHAQVYDFERVGPGPSITLRGEWRREPEDSVEGAFEELARRSGLVHEMGTFFEEVVRRAKEAGLDRPRFGIADSAGNDLGIRLNYGGREDDKTTRFETRYPIEIPQSGRVWVDDDAQRSLLARQRRAVRRLSMNLELVNQLQAPHSLELAVPRTSHPGVDRDTAALLEKIESSWPFFAVQGPPGTGKTFLSSWVIRNLLEREPYARLLVCAQAHSALDNLLESAVDVLRGRLPLAVRVASENTKEKVSPLGASLLPENLVKALRERIENLPIPSDQAISQIVRRWRVAAKEHKLDVELRSRVILSAAIVFSTCASAGSRLIDPDATFDLVVVEEAARGWLTEMLVPMVRGERWLLVGDQRQLPAFEASRLRKALRLDIAEQITPLAGGAPVDERLEPYLTYFGHLMECETSGRAPREMLTRQFRMHPDISKLISTFYPRPLIDTDGVRKRPHRITAAWLQPGRSLAWLDTSSFGRDAWEDEGALSNNFEARLVAFIARRLGPFPRHEEKIRSIMVLSPYLAQLSLLARKNITGVRDKALASVDSFQGGESEVVLVSLVRFNSYEATSKGIGFLEDSERVNVMFSRARRLLLVIGALSHFERFEHTYWPEIGRALRTDGLVVNPSDFGFFARER